MSVWRPIIIDMWAYNGAIAFMCVDLSTSAVVFILVDRSTRAVVFIVGDLSTRKVVERHCIVPTIEH